MSIAVLDRSCTWLWWGGGLTVDNVASKLVLFRNLGIGQCVIGSEPRGRISCREFHAIGHCGREGRGCGGWTKRGDDSDVEQCPYFFLQATLMRIGKRHRAVIESIKYAPRNISIVVVVVAVEVGNINKEVNYLMTSNKECVTHVSLYLHFWHFKGMHKPAIHTIHHYHQIQTRWRQWMMVVVQSHVVDICSVCG